jgi:hypothetical protein
VAIVLSYGRARVLLAGDAKASNEEHSPAVRTRGLKRGSKFKTAKSFGLKFCAMLTVGEVRMSFHREVPGRVGP